MTDTAFISHFAQLPPGVEAFQTEASTDCGEFLRLSPECIKQGTLKLELPAPGRWLALARHGFYWNHPEFGSLWETVPYETQFLLWELVDGGYGLLLPLIAGDNRATISGGRDGLHLVWEGALGDATAPAVLLFSARGENPYTLVEDSVAAVADQLKSFRTRQQKLAPEFANLLGWCTWDAFYHEVDEAKVYEGLRTFKEGGVVPGFMILDDGWLDTTGDYLNAVTPDPKKFPNGLAQLGKTAKKEYGIQRFGVWHNFLCYWAGVNPEGKVAKEYGYVQNRGKIRPWLGDKDPEIDLNLITPDQASRYYHELYRYLRSQGVDLVKVDGQSALELFTIGKLGRVSTMRAFQEALQGAAFAHLGGELLHCMCNGSDVAYQMNASMGWRNSGDYMPRFDDKFQQGYVATNAMNNLWSGQFSLPDWDMFQTHAAHAEYHAAARAISGGPIYVSDKPGQQNFAILKELVITGSRILRFQQPALPSPECLFNDYTKVPQFLKVFNLHESAALVGLFQCNHDVETITDIVCVQDAPGLAGERFALWGHRAQTLVVIGEDDNAEFTLNRLEYELVTLAPITKGVAALGLLDKMSGIVAIDNASWLTPSIYQTILLDGGRIGFYSAKRPKLVRTSITGAEVRYDGKTKLLEVILPAGEAVGVELEF
ncbi:MAG: Sip1-related alpha-galactosidase [Verrucomicrobiota bacterium]|nr:Sip1-related alpha-galactosidase [Verrucomicrobiota bacterium]